MANELKHSSVGTELTQAEWEAVDGHVVNSQAVGDLIYAETTSSLQRLGVGSTNDVLRVTSGKPDWQATSFITSLGTIATGVWQGTDVGVAYGGTGVSTLTDGGVLLGSGASAITAMAVLTDGQMIVGDGSTDPVAESGATLRSSIGIGTGDSPSFTALTLDGDLGFTGPQAITTTSGALTVTPTTDTLFSNGTGVVIGHTAQIVTQELQVLGTGSDDSTVSVGRWPGTNDAAGGFMMHKSRGNSIAAPGTSVANNDKLGQIEWFGDDAANWIPGASIVARVNGTPTTNEMPTELVFATTAATNSVTERMRILSDGTVEVVGVLSVDSTTESTSATTGSIHTDGGLGVAKKLFLNGNLDFSGGTGTIEKVAGENTLYWRKTALVHSAANAGSSQALIVENQSSTAHSHGKLQMQALNGDAFVYYVTTTGATVEWAAGLDHTDAQSFVVSNSSGLGSSNVLKIPNSSGHIVASRGISVDDTTESTSTTTGSIHTDGGLGVVKNAFFGGTHLLQTNSATSKIEVETTGSGASATLESQIPASGTGNAQVVLRQGDGQGAANNMLYELTYSAGNNWLRLRSADFDGSGTTGDIWRIYDGNADIRAKDDWVDDYFDYICDGCNKHSGELFACCGAVKWHDDVLALREMGKDEKIMQRMVDLGVMHRDDRDGWVGISLQAAQHFTWSGIYQNRTRMDAQYETLNDRMELLERTLEAA